MALCCQVYSWMPEAFTEADLNDTNNAFAQEAKRKLGDRLDANYIGVTCDGEVLIMIIDIAIVVVL